MSVDKFGRHHWTLKGGKKGGFKLTSAGDYDMENKRLVNVKNPEDDYDAINKYYFLRILSLKVSKLQGHMVKMEKSIQELQQKLNIKQ